jgi:hypothetical protein
MGCFVDRLGLGCVSVEVHATQSTRRVMVNSRPRIESCGVAIAPSQRPVFCLHYVTADAVVPGTPDIPGTCALDLLGSRPANGFRRVGQSAACQPARWNPPMLRQKW